MDYSKQLENLYSHKLYNLYNMICCTSFFIYKMEQLDANINAKKKKNQNSKETNKEVALNKLVIVS